MDCSTPGSLSMEFSRQEYWSGLPCPLPGDLPNPGIEPRSPTLQEALGDYETSVLFWKSVISTGLIYLWLWTHIFHNIIMLVFHHVIMSFQTNQTDPSWFLFFNFTFSEGGSQHSFNFYKQLVIGSSMTRIKSDWAETRRPVFF